MWVRAGLKLFQGFWGRNATIRKSGWVAKNGKWLSRNDFGGELATGRIVRSELTRAFRLVSPLVNCCADVASRCQHEG